MGTQKANPHGMVDPKNDSRTILYRVTALRLRKPLELPGTKLSSKNADSHRVSNLPEDRKLRTGAHQHSMGEGIKKRDLHESPKPLREKGRSISPEGLRGLCVYRGPSAPDNPNKPTPPHLKK